MNQAKILLMFANGYDMKDEEGKRLSGISVEYYFWGENGEVLESKYVAENQPGGVRRAKASLDTSQKAHITKVPAIYNGEFEMSIGADGKPVTKLVSVNRESDVKFITDNPVIPEKETSKK